MHEIEQLDQLQKHLRQTARALCPDYPWQNDDAFEHLWALTESLRGTRAANDDCHHFIKWLLAELNWSHEEALKLYQMYLEDSHER